MEKYINGGYFFMILTLKIDIVKYCLCFDHLLNIHYKLLVLFFIVSLKYYHTTAAIESNILISKYKLINKILLFY